MSTAGTNAPKVVGEQAQDAAERPARIPRLNEQLTEELVIALVGPVGSGCTTTFATLKEILSSQYSYEVHHYKLSEYTSISAGVLRNPCDSF